MNLNGAIKFSKRIAMGFAIALVLLVSPRAAAQEQDWLSYFPAVSRLHGKLIKITKYGKPTYGASEKDEKVEVPILVLSLPVRIKPRPDSSVNKEPLTNVSFVQLVFPPEMSDYSKHMDRDVTIAGTLIRGYKGDHFTDAVMIVKAVNPTGRPM